MQAMVLEQIAPIDTSPLHYKDVPDPQPGAQQVRIRVSCCAICRTDLHIIEGDLPAHRLPLVVGHQAVGVIDALGPGCRTLRLGQRVGIAWLRHTDGTCEFCRTERENLCPAAAFTGYDADGGYAQYAVVEEDFAYDIPSVFSDLEAAPLLCAGIIGYRSLRRASPRPACRLALYGFGSSAHVVMQIALHRGYEVYVATRGENHRQLARDMGAAWVGEHPSQMPVPCDSAILFAPAGELVPPAMQALKKGGTLALAGIYVTPIPSLDYERDLFHERDLRSVTCNTREDGRDLLAEAAQIPIRPHVTTYPLRDANRALQDLKHDRINGTGVLLMNP
jgi:propanol-preferring alcohol dehydrogenase